MEQQQMRDRDLVLPPSTFAFVLDSTKGRVSVYVGPNKQSLSNTDRLVLWDERYNTFEIEDNLERAVQRFVKASEGRYVILNDPAAGNDGHGHPPIGMTTDATELQAGRKIIIPGPAQFPLWPGQSATVLDGHHLKSNQYLLVRVYEPEQAQKHAESAVVAPNPAPGAEPAKAPKALTARHRGVLGDTALTMGQLIVVRGTVVSFFVPSTGIEVLPEGNAYVREAVTLERLEYCVLLDEDGEKRYTRGPAVVFPEPTERFIEDEDGNRKFRAIELNEQSGLYLKVIAPYTEDKTVHNTGDELFITGKDQAIYFPRPEHLIIHYGEQKKHHAIAIPKGEGRYVLDRRSGDVPLVRGPNMFLPDPRHEVVVRRILDPAIVAVMYPGNAEALKINREFEQELAQQHEAETVPDETYLASSTYAMASSAPQAKVLRGGVSSHFGGESVHRSTTYRKPRTITLDTKYEGAVAVNIWPGYAVLVTDKSGARRVEEGPKAVLLEYDETLMALSLSTGTPKTADDPLRTVYLRTVNNVISDRVTVETSDLVPVELTLSYRVNFEGDDPLSWFDIENYVALLTDNCRSRLRNIAKRHGVKGFYTNYIDIIRDALLGEAIDGGQRVGRFFEENSMHIYDVEVPNAEINDPAVRHLLNQAMQTSMTGAIQLAQTEEETLREARLHELTRQRLHEDEITREAEAKAGLAELERELARQLRDTDLDLQVAEAAGREKALSLTQERAQFEQSLDLQAKLDATEMARLKTETDQFIRRMEKLSGGVVEALGLFGDKLFVEKLVESIGPLALATGVNLTDILAQVFKGTSFDNILTTLTTRPYSQGGNGQHMVAEATH